LLVATLWLAMGRRYLDWLVVVGLLVFLPPYAWENILQGFQSAFYFMLLFSVLGLWLTTQQPIASLAWWIGWGCALAGIFTAAGGLLLPPVVLGVTFLGGWRHQRKQLVLVAAVAAVMTAIAVVALSPPLPHHELLRARTVLDFVTALARNLAWPFIGRPFAALILWLPTGLLILRRVITRTWLDGGERYLVGLAIWVVLQAAAVAYGRGAGGPLPASRYHDFLSLGFVANSVALISLISRMPDIGLRRWRWPWWGLAVWLGLASVGILRLSGYGLNELRGWRQSWAAEARHVRDYVISGDLEAFVAHRGVELPYPDGNSLAMTLQDPYIRSILPAAVRAPLHAVPQTVTNDAFAPGGVYPSTPADPVLRGWGTYVGPGNPTRGHFVSSPLPPCEPGRSLLFPVAGYLGMPGLILGVHELTTGKQAFASPSVYAREAWADVQLPCPASAFSIVAADERADYWFGFREPVEVGRLTWTASTLIAVAPMVAAIGLLMIVLAARWT
jgi:hypothetical protein